MKVLFLTLNDEYEACSQVRVYQFLPYFKEMGIEYKVEPFFTSKMRERTAQDIKFRKRFGITGSAVKIFIRDTWLIMKRSRVILSAAGYDAVVVQKDVLPFGLQGLLCMINPNIIFEFDDAIWELTPDQKNKPAILKTYYEYEAGLFPKILRNSKIVLAENSYLADYAKKFNNRVKILTAPIDTSVYKPMNTDKNTDKLVLGWIGSPSTVYLLKKISPALERLGQKYTGKIELHNIGGEPFELKNIEVENIKWDNDKVKGDFSKLDIGLMPLDDEPYNRGRLGYKMIIYMSLGIPFVAQDIGLNKEVVKNGTNGYLATSQDDWVKYLSELIENKDLRQKLGQKGREIAVSQYDIRQKTKEYAEFIREAASKS